MRASEIAACTGGTVVVGDDPMANMLVWDSRKVSPGCLYVAFPGERVDGHRFVASSIEAGATVALISQEPDEEMCAAAKTCGAALVRVENTPDAVTDLARAWREKLHGRVIGLTGSVGKTTTKNLVRDVLAAQFKTVATEKNQNNELGVPNTVLRADVDTEVVVVEMGMRGAGQLESLCAFVKPDWGIVTNIGDCHIELLGSRDNIARAKAELICALPDGTGMAFLNAGDAYCDFIKDVTRLSERGIVAVRYDGTYEAAGRGWDIDDGAPAVWATDIELNALSQPRFTLNVRGFGGESEGSRDCRLALRGLHNVSNACAAAAVGCAMGMSLECVCAALADAQPEVGRQEVFTATRGFTVVNDAYNANPDSMKASLSMFASMAVEGRRIAVLGDMGELGDFAAEGHRQVGALAASLPIDVLVCVGPLSADVASAAIEAGMDPERVVRVKHADEALEVVTTMVESPDAVLVKASHYMGLDRVAEGLVR